MVLLFAFGAFITTLMFVLSNSDNETIITIKSKYSLSLGRDESYLVKRKKDRNGNNVDDWVYYNESGDIIDDIFLINLIHSSFINEDWYGDYIFYVNDVSYHTKKISSKLVDVMEYEIEGAII